MSDDLKEILNHLVSTPKESEILIDFDFEKNIFSLSIPIFTCQNELSHAVKEYVQARKNHVFKPHATSFAIEGGKKVTLIQRIPFQWGLASRSRQEILDFHRLAKRCHRILYEIAIEEKYREALHCLDSDS